MMMHHPTNDDQEHDMARKYKSSDTKSSLLVVNNNNNKLDNLERKGAQEEGGVILTPHHFQWQRLKFPHRLFHLLNLLEREGLSTLAHWDENGTSFRVPKSTDIVDNFLPYFFQQNKWKSFQRQLNAYEFTRIESGPLKGYYYHSFFVRSNIALAHKIRRKKQTSDIASSSFLMSSPPSSCCSRSTDVNFPASLHKILTPRGLPFVSSSIQVKNAVLPCCNNDPRMPDVSSCCAAAADSSFCELNGTHRGYKLAFGPTWRNLDCPLVAPPSSDSISSSFFCGGGDSTPSCHFEHLFDGGEFHVSTGRGNDSNSSTSDPSHQPTAAAASQYSCSLSTDDDDDDEASLATIDDLTDLM